MNKQIAKKLLLNNVNACYNATKENGWQSEMLKESIDNIVDEIEPDHPKVKLPREVGEAWIEYVDSRQTDRGIDRMDMALVLLVREECPNDNVQSWYTVTPGALAILVDAYRYGWEDEPESKWYVQTPKEWWEKSTVQEWIRLDALRGVCSGFDEPGRTAFTRSELKKYHLDSDIFTLVPVGEEK